MDINKKTAVITGGASGLGEASVRRLASIGANVVIFDMDSARGQNVAAELSDKVSYCDVNVTDEASVQAAIDFTVKKHGAIHICCNYAGIASGIKTYDARKQQAHPLDAFKKVLDVNLTGSFNVARLAAEAMSKNEVVTDCGQRGVIINTASVAGYEGQVGQVAYSASKGGIIAMTLVIARDLAQLGIRCNTIVPGLIHTPLFESLPEPVFTALSNSPLNPRRLGKPDEIARTAQYILENDYINGECIRVDGGIRMQPK